MAAYLSQEGIVSDNSIAARMRRYAEGSLDPIAQVLVRIECAELTAEGQLIVQWVRHEVTCEFQAISDRYDKWDATEKEGV